MNEQAITPRDCALLVALPLTESEFDADLNAGDKKDFVRQVIARSYPGLRSERLRVTWAKSGSPVSALITDITPS